ncbi:MAG: hypothetical protein WDZ27_06500 [Waddliaceae bacterium]
MQHVSIGSLEESKTYDQNLESDSEWNEKIAKILTVISSDPVLDEIKREELLAKAKYLISKNETIINIEEQFKENLDHSQRELESIREIYKRTGLKGEKATVSLKKAYMIADYLVQHDGHININLIPLLISEFKEECDTPRLILGLNELKSSPEICRRIFEIKLPEEGSRSYELIRIAMNIITQNSPTRNDARKLVLSSLLSNFRQGKRGTCFSTPLIITSLYAAKKKHLEDLFNLTENNIIERETHEAVEEFPFILRNNPLFRYPTVTLDEFGNISSVPLWELPGIKAVCRYLKIENPRDVIIKNFKIPGEVNLEKVIQVLAEDGAKSPHLKPRAYFVYNAQCIHPLLSAWENALLGMAEGFSTSLIRSRITHTINNVIISNLDHVKTAIKADILKKIGFHYDTRVLVDEDSPLGSADGAFIMYDKSDPKNWKRITTKEMFQEVLGKTFKDDKKIADWIQTEAFIAAIEKEYDPNSRINRPWKTFCGNDFEAVLNIFSRGKRETKEQMIEVKDASDLLEKLINHIRLYSEEKKIEITQYPFQRTPARIYMLHAFSILEGHHTLRKAWKSEIAADQWVNNNLITPFKELCRVPINSILKKKIKTICMEDIRLHEKQKEVKRVIKNAHTDHTSILEFRNDLALCLSSKADLMCKIDSIILDFLPANKRVELLKSSVHIGDSNWQVNGDDLHLACMFNPASGTLNLWLISEDNQKVFTIDQNAWVAGKPWEIYTER